MSRDAAEADPAIPLAIMKETYSKKPTIKALRL
jgi:hypothetical protein